jgi:phosphoribosylformylglycinamidine synthase
LGYVQNGTVELIFNQEVVLQEPVRGLHAAWEETSYQLERLQANPQCAEQEWRSHRSEAGTRPYRLSFDPDVDVTGHRRASVTKPKAAILREEGSNGDREMAAAFLAAGFEPWDVTMTDLINGAITLESFQLIAFVGGFSFGDVLDSAKGWASVIRNNERLSEEFARLFARSDTLSLGVCNGCQLMALLGIPGFDLPDNLGALRVPFQHCSDREEPRGHASGDGGLDTGDLGGSRRGPPACSRPGDAGSDR